MNKNIRGILISVALVASLLPALAQAQNLFVADFYNGGVYEFTPSGDPALFASVSVPAGLAFDSANNLYVASLSWGTIQKVAPDGTSTMFASGVGNPLGLAFDSAGNLYAAGYTSGVVSEFTPGGVQSTFASGLGDICGLAFDGAGNLFVTDLGGGRILEVTPAGVVSVFASGLAEPYAIAFDGVGNLFESDYGTGNIYKFTSGGVQSTFASGLGSIAGLAFDTAGNLFVSSGEQGIYRIAPDGTISMFATGSRYIPFMIFQPGPLNFQIISQPQSQVAFLGMSVSFSVSTTAGVPPLTYQWLLGGVAIPDATNSLLVLTNFQATNAGVYTVVVTDAASNTLTSFPATLTVNPVLPIITWTSPAPINYGTALDTNHLNATASFAGTNVSGTFAYTPTNGTVLSVGSNTLSVIFTPGDLVDYSSVTDTVSLLVFASQAQNLIVNGSFESPAEPLNAFTVAVPSGWSGGDFIVNGNLDGGLTPEDGNQYEDIGNGGYGPFSQTFNVPVAGQYLLAWSDKEYSDWAYSYAVSITGNQTAAYSEVSSGDWISRFLSVRLSAGTNTLVFQPTGDSGDTLIDNVSLVPLFSITQTAPIINWTNSAPILYGTALSSNQLNATANVPGSFAYVPTNGTVLSVGSNTLSVIFTPGDPVDYSSVTDSVSLVVSELPGIGTISVSGANLMMNGSNGVVGATYYVLTSTNIALPLNEWAPVATNTWSANGNFNLIVTNAVNQSVPMQFYILQVP